jgi:hypothetical protein
VDGPGILVHCLLPLMCAQAHGHIAFPLELTSRDLDLLTGARVESGGPHRSANNASPTGAEQPLGPSVTGTASMQYALIAVVVHSGGASSGHYYTYRSCVVEGATSGGPPQRRVWFRASDSHVHEVQVQEVLACEAAALLYERQ